jgi:hypothetical protein
MKNYFSNLRYVVIIAAFFISCQANKLVERSGLDARARTIIVAQNHPRANDNGKGTTESPFQTINRAAQEAMPGDTILVFKGIYRERVAPARGGEPGKYISYKAGDKNQVYIRGSEEFKPQWEKIADNIFHGKFYDGLFGIENYKVDTTLFKETNPFKVGFDRNLITRPQSGAIGQVLGDIENRRNRIYELYASDRDTMSQYFRLTLLQDELNRLMHEENPYYRTALGQVFIEGVPLQQATTYSELHNLEGTWMTDPDGEGIIIHLPDSDPLSFNIEISTRHTVFSPVIRNLGYIQVDGFIIEHAANHYNAWGPQNWSQVGALSTRSGHHWIIKNNTICFARGIGIDCGSENEVDEKIEFAGELSRLPELIEKAYLDGSYPDMPNLPGHHLLINNKITDNGMCGITGIGQIGTIIRGNIIERNNFDGNTSPLWEFGGMKFHYFFNGRIEGNLIRDNDAHGIWLDNQWRDTRITRNTIINNLWSGINIELARGPVMIDNNIIAYTRQGSGIYGHDVSQATIAHNLLYANAGHGVWLAYATPRIKPEDGCWDHKIINNMILGNSSGAIGLPVPWRMGGNNFSDGNLFMGGGEYPDEGTGPLPAQFQFNNFSHMGKMSAGVPEGTEPMTGGHLYETVKKIFEQHRLPLEKLPDSMTFTRNFMVSREVWQMVLNNDRNSREISVIKDGLQSRSLSWTFQMPDDLMQVSCQPLEGVSIDFSGYPFPETHLLPGPFQDIAPGRIRKLLWPVKLND